MSLAYQLSACIGINISELEWTLHRKLTNLSQSIDPSSDLPQLVHAKRLPAFMAPPKSSTTFPPNTRISIHARISSASLAKDGMTDMIFSQIKKMLSLARSWKKTHKYFCDAYLRPRIRMSLRLVRMSNSSEIILTSFPAFELLSRPACRIPLFSRSG